MQSAKKLVLVDEFDREYKRLQRPADAVAKTDHTLRLSDTLRDGSLSNDRSQGIRCETASVSKHRQKKHQTIKW